MSTIKNVLIRWAALPIWTVLLGFSVLPAIAGTLQPPGTATNQGENRAADPPSQSAGSAKPDGTEAPSLGKPADSSVAPLPAATPDNRDLIRRRRQAGEIKAQPPNQSPPIGLLRGSEVRRLQFRQHKMVNRIPRPVPVFHRWNRGTKRGFESPMIVLGWKSCFLRPRRNAKQRKKPDQDSSGCPRSANMGRRWHSVFEASMEIYISRAAAEQGQRNSVNLAQFA